MKKLILFFACALMASAATTSQTQNGTWAEYTTGGGFQNYASINFTFSFPGATLTGSSCSTTGSGDGTTGGFAGFCNFAATSINGTTTVRAYSPGPEWCTDCTWTYASVTATLTYTPANSAPVTVSITGIPTNINLGVNTDFTATWRDADGWSNLTTVLFLLNNAVAGAHACYVQLDVNSQTIAIQNDGGTAFGTAVALGSANTLSNSQCQVDVANSSFTSRSGTDAVARIRIKFLPGFLAYQPFNSYLYANDSATNSGWSASKGSGTVRTGPKLFISN